MPAPKIHPLPGAFILGQLKDKLVCLAHAGFGHFITQEHCCSGCERKLISPTQRELIPPPPAPPSATPQVIWALERWGTQLQFPRVEEEMSAGFSFPNQARALLGTICFGSEPTLGATSCFRTSCFNLFLVSHHLLRLLPPPGIRAGSPCWLSLPPSLPSFPVCRICPQRGWVMELQHEADVKIFPLTSSGHAWAWTKPAGNGSSDLLRAQHCNSFGHYIFPVLLLTSWCLSSEWSDKNFTGFFDQDRVKSLVI